MDDKVMRLCMRGDEEDIPDFSNFSIKKFSYIECPDSSCSFIRRSRCFVFIQIHSTQEFIHLLNYCRTLPNFGDFILIERVKNIWYDLQSNDLTDSDKEEIIRMYNMCDAEVYSEYLYR